MLLGFKPRFVEPILKGSKIFTIRDRRKNPPKPDERLYMYTGLRTRNCIKVSDDKTLKGWQSIRLTIKRVDHKLNGKDVIFYAINIWVERRLLLTKEKEKFYVYDGFKDEADFAEYWLAGKKRAGGLKIMFHWTDFKY